MIEYSSNYSDTTSSLWIYSKDEATNFDAGVANNYAFTSLEYKAKLIENTVVDGNNSILTNAAINAPLNYLINLWGSLEMPLINCKVKLKLRQMKHCALASAGAENTDANSNNIFCTIKCIKLHVPVVTLSLKDNQKLSNF